MLILIWKWNEPRVLLSATCKRDSDYIQTCNSCIQRSALARCILFSSSWSYDSSWYARLHWIPSTFPSHQQRTKLIAGDVPSTNKRRKKSKHTTRKKRVISLENSIAEQNVECANKERNVACAANWHTSTTFFCLRSRNNADNNDKKKRQLVIHQSRGKGKTRKSRHPAIRPNEITNRTAPKTERPANIRPWWTSPLQTTPTTHNQINACVALSANCSQSQAGMSTHEPSTGNLKPRPVA